MFTEQNINRGLYGYHDNYKCSKFFPFTYIQVITNNDDYLLFKKDGCGSWLEVGVNKLFQLSYLIGMLKTLNIYKIRKIQNKNNEFTLCFSAEVDYDTQKELVPIEQLEEYWESRPRAKIVLEKER